MNRVSAFASPLVVFAAAAVLVSSIAGCKKKPPPDDTPPPTTIASATEPVPPAASFNATPVAQFADAGPVEGLTPIEQAKAYKATGQLWMARLHIETRALSAAGTKEEAELLLEICMEQGDANCVERCGEKLKRKIKFDAGPSEPVAAAAPSAIEHKEPDSDLAKARDLLLKMRLADARKILEQKVLDGRATREETRMLKTICEKEGDRMCVALCNTKLK